MERLIRHPISPLVAGLVLGTLAVLAGEVGGLYPPEHYGFCTTCHGRDLVVGIAGQLGLFTARLTAVPPLWPLLTTVGVITGAWISARAAGETTRRESRLGVRAAVGSAVRGFLVMSFALLTLGCPIRLALRAADLSAEGGIGLLGVAAGVGLGVAWLRIRA